MCEQTPEYQAWERERNRPIHEPDADELGWQAEQRFYAEQDPTSQWYREDLYHGEPGPDVAIDLAEQEMRQREREMEFADKNWPMTRPNCGSQRASPSVRQMWTTGSTPLSFRRGGAAGL